MAARSVGCATHGTQSANNDQAGVSRPIRFPLNAIVWANILRGCSRCSATRPGTPLYPSRALHGRTTSASCDRPVRWCMCPGSTGVIPARTGPEGRSMPRTGQSHTGHETAHCHARSRPRGDRVQWGAVCNGYPICFGHHAGAQPLQWLRSQQPSEDSADSGVVDVLSPGI